MFVGQIKNCLLHCIHFVNSELNDNVKRKYFNFLISFYFFLEKFFFQFYVLVKTRSLN